MAHQRFHATPLRDRILGYLAKEYPYGHSAGGVHTLLQQERVSCVRSAVYKALDAMVTERWLTAPRVAANIHVGQVIDGLIEDLENGTSRTKISYVGYRLTKRGILAALAALARLALDRGDHVAVKVWLTELQRRLSRKAPSDGPIAFPGHKIVVSKRDYAQLRSLLRKPALAPNAQLRAAAERFKRDVASGEIVVHADTVASVRRARGPRARGQAAPAPAPRATSARAPRAIRRWVR